MKHLLLLLLTLFTPLSASAEPRETTIKHIPYIKGSDLKKHTLDLYLPKQKTKNTPVHIFVHGGGWNIGDKKSIKAKEAKTFTDAGVILVTLNYRLSPAVQHPAHIQDVAAGVKWVNDNIAQYGGDPKNIVLSGHSAGGHLVALLGTDAQYLKKHGLRLNMFKAIIPIDHSKYDLTLEHKGPLARLVKRWTKNAFGTDAENLKDGSPIYKDLTQNLSPFLVTVSGDRAHAKAESKRFIDELKKNKQAASLLVIDGYSHRKMKQTLFEANSETFRKVMEFLN